MFFAFCDGAAADTFFEIEGPGDAINLSPNHDQYHAQTFQIDSTEVLASIELPLGRDSSVNAPFNISIWEGEPFGILAGNQLLGTTSIDETDVEHGLAKQYEQLIFENPVKLNKNQTYTIEFWTLSSDSYRIARRNDDPEPSGSGFRRLNVLTGGQWELVDTIDIDYVFRLQSSVGLVIGDVNCDGQINLLDVQPFVELLSNGLFDVKADINQDGFLNLLDVAPFIDILSGP